MPFNSQSYYRNKAKRQALAYLAEARAIKRRLAMGEPDFLDSLERVQSRVRFARSQWKTYLGHLRMDQCEADIERLRRREITYAEFMSKWDIRKDEHAHR